MLIPYVLLYRSVTRPNLADTALSIYPCAPRYQAHYDAVGRSRYTNKFTHTIQTCKGGGTKPVTSLICWFAVKPPQANGVNNTAGLRTRSLLAVATQRKCLCTIALASPKTSRPRRPANNDCTTDHAFGRLQWSRGGKRIPPFPFAGIVPTKTHRLQ